jgi:hypothetical protein
MPIYVHDLYEHVSNKIANKYNDPWGDMWPMVIPVDTDGSFVTPITSDNDEYESDSYVLIKKLCFSTEKLPTGSFGFVCPIKARSITIDNGGTPETEEPTLGIVVVAVNSPEDMGFGIWNLSTNEFMEMPPDSDGDGALLDALGALAFKWQIDNGKLGTAGEMLKLSMELAEKSAQLAKEAMLLMEQDKA